MDSTPDPRKTRPRRYLVAAALALISGAVAWFELVYFYFGLVGEDPSHVTKLAAGVMAFGFAVGWPLRGAHRPAEVAVRSAHFGTVVAVLLPVVAFAVLFLWENSSGRRDLGMGGLMLYSLPIVALGLSAVLAIFFWLCRRYATRRLQRDIGTTLT